MNRETENVGYMLGGLKRRSLVFLYTQLCLRALQLNIQDVFNLLQNRTESRRMNYTSARSRLDQLTTKYPH